jgi:hypothetical protein
VWHDPDAVAEQVRNGVRLARARSAQAS